MNGIWIDIFRTGVHTPASGLARAFTHKDLDNAIETFEATKGDYQPVFRIGHHKEGIAAPAGGKITGLKREGDVLRGRVDAIPIVREAIKNGLYNGVSSGLRFSKKLGDKVYPAFLDHVALLGHKIPAVKGLNGPDGLAALFDDEDDGDVAIFTFETEDKDVELKEMQAKLLDEQSKNRELTDKLATADTNFSAAEDKHAAEITALKATHKTELDAESAKVAEFDQAAAKVEVEAVVMGAIRGGRLAPVQKDTQVKMGLNARNQADFSEGDEKSLFGAWKTGLEKAPKVMDFNEKAKVEGEGNDGEDAEFSQGQSASKKHARNSASRDQK